MKQFSKNIILGPKLGQGGMATVYEAELSGPGGFKKRVAVKIPNPEFVSNDSFRAAFHLEAQVMAKLSHPNIAAILNVGIADSKPYLVIEYIDGLTLKTILEMANDISECLNVAFVLFIVDQVTRAIAYAHAQGVIHCDLSPHNIMIDSSGTLKVLDFGIAKLLSDSDSDSKTKSLKGKFSYMSPETLEGHTPSTQSDLFSLGTIIFELLFGVGLFKGKSDFETIENVKEAKIPNMASLRNDVSATIRETIVSCLKRNPNARMNSCSELIERLVGEPKLSPEEAIEYINALKAKHESRLQNSDSTVQDVAILKNSRKDDKLKIISRKLHYLVAGIVASILIGTLFGLQKNGYSFERNSESVKGALNRDVSSKDSQSSQVSKKCQKICHKGVACGDACIPLNKTCRQPPGTACNEKD